MVLDTPWRQLHAITDPVKAAAVQRMKGLGWNRQDMMVTAGAQCVALVGKTGATVW